MKSRVQRGREKNRYLFEGGCQISVDCRGRVIECEPRPPDEVPRASWCGSSWDVRARSSRPRPSYHERTEEKFVFPRLQAARREVALVTILLRQHERGRQLTDEILRRASAGASAELAQVLRSFGHMYRAHAAREDTVLFPAFRKLVGGNEYEELGEQFEEREHQLLESTGSRAR